MRRLKLIILSFLLVNTGISQQYKYSSIFDIHLSQDFEDDTPGDYDYYECMEDWNNPVWITMDPAAQILVSTDPQYPGKYMKFIYPKGSVSLGEVMGGGQWFAPLNDVFNELYFSYRIKFIPGFEPVLSGKLPGILGGPQWRVDTPPGYDDGFAFHFSWNHYPDLVVYLYHQDQPGQSGESWPTGYGIPTNKWFTITFRMVMNTITNGRGNNDGILETFIDGKLQHQITHLRYRNNESIGIDHLMIESFFGGSGDIWAAIRNEWIEFDDFVAFTYKSDVNVPRGNILSASDRSLILPYKSTTETPDPVDSVKISLSPNPTNGIFQLYLTNYSISDFKLIITDVSGREIITKKFTESYSDLSFEFDLSDQPGGCYLVFIISNHKTIIKKIIKY